MLHVVTFYLSWFQYNLHAAFMRRKLGRLGKQFTGTVLDIGAGDQPYRKLFPCDRYIATNTRRHYAGNEESMAAFTDLWIEDASALPLEDASVDHVVCFQVMSVVKDPEQFFHEVYRVLRPGGYFLLTTDFLYPSWSAEDKGRYSAAELKRLSGLSGMGIAAVEGFGGLRSLQYMLRARWIRGYYSRIRSARGLRKMARFLQWMIYLAGLPAESIYARIIFLLEAHIADNTEETFNLLLLAQKPLTKQA